eukprot:11547162-Alexandrium_andersonii.AAC.1
MAAAAPSPVAPSGGARGAVVRLRWRRWHVQLCIVDAGDDARPAQEPESPAKESWLPLAART